MDEEGWRWMCSVCFPVYRDALSEMAASARRIATQYVDPQLPEAYVASRLIPLNKKPDIRPIGVGEVIRRILGKVSLYIIGNDIQEAAGCLQLCAGQECGVEAAIHAMQQA